MDLRRKKRYKKENGIRRGRIRADAQTEQGGIIMWAEEKLSQLTLEEKIRMLSGKDWWQTVDYPEKGIPSITLADGPCGLRKQEGEGDHLGINDSIPATATVSGACLAASWNPECARKNGQLLGEEAANAGVDVLLAPALNLVRSPLCGRNFEYFSEDPYLTGEIAAAYAKGVQEAGVGCCLKHYAGNNQETEREFINAVIDERTLRELYLPGFETAVKEADPMSVMAALNQINGEYGAEHKHLLSDILREEWGFQGFTVSDWFGIVHPAKAVEAGMDLDMPFSGGVGAEKIRKAVEEGSLSEEAVDKCCLRLLRGVERSQEMKKLRTAKSREELHREHHELVREIAREGIVLLKNEDGILPLKGGESLAVIGKYAKEPRYTLEGSARVINTGLDIPYDFIKEQAAEAGCGIIYAQGYAEEESFPSKERGGKKESSPEKKECTEEVRRGMEEEALQAAKNSSIVLFFLGQPAGVEMEGHDRKSISLPKEQEELLEKVCEVNPNVVVILSNASAVAMPWIDRVKGALECFMAGQGMGCALAEILFGIVNPSGKLPVSFTKRLEDTSAYFHFPGNKKEVTYGEGVFAGYRYYDKKRTDLLFPFGYGLSYTRFVYSDMKPEREVFGEEEEKIFLSLKVKNTGERAGAEVVQLYVGMFDSIERRPEKELKRFCKVFLEAGEEKTVTFTLNKRDLAFYYAEKAEWLVPDGTYYLKAGASCQDIRLEKAITVYGKKKHRKPVSGWSTIGELRETEAGEKVFWKIMEYLEPYIPKEGEESDSIFKRMLSRDKINQMFLRRVILVTSGRVDNDMLLSWVEEANADR